MGRALSNDLRDRVIRAVEGGLSRNAAAARFGVSIASAIRWVDVWRRTGRREALRMGGDRRSRRLEAAGATIVSALKAKADLTLGELVGLVARRHGIVVAKSTIWRFLDRHALTFKKNGARRRARAARRGRAPGGVDRGSRRSGA